MVVVQAAVSAGRAAVTAGKAGSKAVKLGAQGAKAGSQAAQKAAGIGGRYATSVERTAGGMRITTTAKEGTLRKEFGEYARAQRIIRERLRQERDKFFARESASPEKVSLFSYAGPMTVAVFKDALDVFFIGSLPLIGTAITLCCGILMFLLLAMSSRATVRSRSAFLLRAGMMVGGTSIVEGVAFGANFMPFQTFSVILLYASERSGALQGGAAALGQARQTMQKASRM